MLMRQHLSGVMTMHEQWTDQLSDYLDGELSSEEQAADRRSPPARLRRGARQSSTDLEAHRRRGQQTLEARPPQADVWSGIAARIDAAPSGARA